MSVFSTGHLLGPFPSSLPCALFCGRASTAQDVYACLRGSCTVWRMVLLPKTQLTALISFSFSIKFKIMSTDRRPSGSSMVFLHIFVGCTIFCFFCFFFMRGIEYIGYSNSCFESQPGHLLILKQII